MSDSISEKLADAVRGAGEPPRARSAARMPDCAAQPGCMRLVHVPSARYSMIPAAMEPAMPSAFTNSVLLRFKTVPAAAAAPIAPRTAVGWKPALWMSFGATRLARQVNSTPSAMARIAVLPGVFSLSDKARTAGTITAPAWIGPPSKVSSKSSPCAAVPLTNAAPAESSARAWPIAVHFPEASQPASAACT